MRKSEFDIDFTKAPLSSVKPSEDDPIRAIVLTGEELDQLTLEDWNRVSCVLRLFSDADGGSVISSSSEHTQK
jgi:hypothetical protein